MDFLFLQFYIKKKYNQSIDEYFSIGKQSTSDWKVANKIPPQRILEFYDKEGSIDILILFKKLYNL